MALTVAEVFQTVIGDRRLHCYTITGDSSHASGGEDLTVAQIGFASVSDPEFAAWVEQTNGYVAWWDWANSKFQVYYGDYSESSDGALIAADGVNLGSVSWTLFAISRYGA